MTDLWLISVPLDKTSSTSVEKLKRTIAKTKLATCCKFSIPELKVRLSIICPGLSDNVFCLLSVSVIRKTCQCMKDVMDHATDKVLENALANGMDLMSYVTQFQWDQARYPTAVPLTSLADMISKEISQVEAELKTQTAAYNNVKSSLQILEHKLEGNLQNRSLNDIVKKEDLIVSEYLTTVLVVVTKANYLLWERTYESMSEFVVPRSSRKLYEDQEGGVFSVTLFKKNLSEFKSKFMIQTQVHRAGVQLRFGGADAGGDEAAFSPQKGTIRESSERHGVYVRWLKMSFSQAFIAWIHLKALRVFVESVLRYGLPVNYQAFLLQTDKKRSKKLRKELASLFVHLDPTATASKKDVNCDIPGLLQQEYFSYISFQISTNVLDYSY
uniref:V-type proton ATPase subunit C n=1 Tax=Anabas testudineus TaxID=64144 RepID=A0A7N6BGL7_ANATE